MWYHEFAAALEVAAVGQVGSDHGISDKWPQGEEAEHASSTTCKGN
jgi:hypothetical protein